MLTGLDGDLKALAAELGAAQDAVAGEVATLTEELIAAKLLIAEKEEIIERLRREAREVEDKRLMDYAATVQHDQLETILEYVNTRGEEKALPLGVVLTHLFNHQTHHRGQATHILRQLGVAEPPSLDLLYFALPTA